MEESINLNVTSLRRFGHDGRAEWSFPEGEGLLLARVTGQQKDLYRVVSEHGFHDARISGQFRFTSREASDYPAVGDWILAEGTGDSLLIRRVLPRKSVLGRKSAGLTAETQIMAANLDAVFLCMSMNENFNLRRLERYLTVAWSSGATPLVLLTKSDLVPDPERWIAMAASVAVGADVLACSELTEGGFRELERFLLPGKTYAFIGSSGVGKSTLVNYLLGSSVLETNAVGKDDKGRHTTTARELFLTPSGAIVIDTPGMRELQIDSADFGTSFSDIETLAEGCRFTDCTHTKEPSCAVLEAVAEGQIPFERLQNYRKMKKEEAYQEERARTLALRFDRLTRRK